MAATTGTTTPSRGEDPLPGSAPARTKPRRGYAIGRGAVPYLLVLPALALELLIHLVPMVVGVVMSFKELTQFYISDRSAAPWKGLDNYRMAVDFNAPVGKDLLNSFVVTCEFTLLAVALSWLF